MTTIFKVGTKSLVRNLLSLSILLGSFAVSSCNDEKFLEEKVYQLTTGTAYETPDQINMAIGYLHNRMQYLSFGRGPAYDNLFTGSGLDGFARVGDESYITSDWSQMTSVNAFTQHWADNFSQMINYSNTIIEACDNSTVKFTSDEQKNTFRAEAIFFRAFAHRCLAGMFGDWAIITEVAKEAKTDYIRHPRLEVWKQCKDDLEFAVKYLPIKTSESGRIVRAAADHLLAEIYISLGDHSDQKEYYAEAIKAASRIIDGTDGSYRLMTERFGSRQAETGKNVYWDLFRAGNFNYQGGNLEAIWVVHMIIIKHLLGRGELLRRKIVTDCYWNSSSYLIGITSTGWRPMLREIETIYLVKVQLLFQMDLPVKMEMILLVMLNGTQGIGQRTIFSTISGIEVERKIFGMPK